MKPFPNTTLSLLALAVASALSAQASAGYGLKDANRSAIKQEAWVCKGCQSKTELTSSVTAGVALQDGEDSHIGNTTGTDTDGATAFLSADIHDRGENDYRLDFRADKLGFDAASANLSIAKPGNYRFYLDYRALARFDSNAARSPYREDGDNLRLPDNWQAAGTTAGMTELDKAATVTLEKKRQRFTLGGTVKGEGFDTELNFRHETRSGASRSTVNLLTNAAMIAKPIDDSTDTLDARVYWRGDGFLGGLNGQISKYRNDHQRLAFDNAFYPTFGAAYNGQMAVDPDNQAFSLGGDLQFFEGAQQALLHSRFARMTQDDPLLPATVTGPSPALPHASADTQVDMMELGLSYRNRLSRELSVYGSYDYRDRDNKTEQAWYPLVTTDSIYRGEVQNTPYDRTRQLLKLGAKYRFGSNWNLDANYSYDHNQYSGLSRDSVFENSVEAALRAQLMPGWRVSLMGEVRARRGDSYQTSELTQAANQGAMRQYFLADRDKRELRLMTDHNFNEVSIQFNLHTGLEDYLETELGLTEVRYTGYGLNAAYPLGDNLSLSGFFGQDWRDNRQTGSANGVSFWQAENRDDQTSASLGLKWQQLMDNKLTLGIDYGYSDGASDTEVSQGLSVVYGPYSATRHNLSAWADYQLADNMSMRLDWLYEDYQDMDWGNDGLMPDSIPNLILLGSLSHDYQAHYVGLSFSYQW